MLQLHTAPIGICLAEVLDDYENIQDADSVFDSCCANAREVQPGDLYVALIGSEHDGHEDVELAVTRGASAILSERFVPSHGVPVFVVEDTRKAYGELCHAFAGYPANELNLIGVTGTNGKTTTAALISAVLAEANKRTGVLSSLGCYDGIEGYARHTSSPTPPPSQLAKWLGRMTASCCQHGVLEISSRALAQHQLSGITLDAVCFTNITHAHLNDHNTLESYRSVKARILDYLANGGLAVFNADDPVSASLLSELEGPVLTYGMENPAEIMATVIERNLCNQSFLLHAGSESAAVRTRLLGDHHVYNCLAAAAIGLANGIDLVTIARGLESVDRLAGRMERIDCGQEFAVFVDDARTPHALAASLKTVNEVTPGQVHCVFGSEGGEATAERAMLASTAEQLSDFPTISNTNPHHEPPRWIAAELMDGFVQSKDISIILDRKLAIETVLSNAKPGDTVLLTGRGAEAMPAADPGSASQKPNSSVQTDSDMVREFLYSRTAQSDTWEDAA